MTKTEGRLDSLTGLRALAALGVLGLHVFSVPGVHDSRYIGWAFSAGGNGVSFFFLLSGFVLAWTWTRGDSARSFYRRRSARIIPAYLLSLFTGLLVLHFVFRAGLPGGPLLASLFMIQDWFRDPRWLAVNGVCWTLSAEAFFYATFPLYANGVFRLTSRARRIGIVLLLGLVVAVGFYGAARTSSTHFYPAPDTTGVWLGRAPFVKVAEFAAGVLLAHEVRAGSWPRIPLRWASAVLGVAYLLACQAPTSAWQVLLLDPAFVLIIAAAAQADLGGNRSALKTRFLVEMGAASYCIYLFHFEVLQTLIIKGPAALHHTVPLLVVELLLAVVLAELLHRLVELPFDRRLRGDGRAVEEWLAASPRPVLLNRTDYTGRIAVLP